MAAAAAQLPGCLHRWLPSRLHGVNKLSGGWTGVLAGAVGHHASPPCRLPMLLLQPWATTSCPQPLGQRVSMRKGAGSAFSSLFWSCAPVQSWQLAAGCSHGRECGPVSPSRSAASLAHTGMASRGCISDGTAALCTGPDPSPLKCQLPRHFKGCHLRETEGSNLTGSAGGEAL